MRGAAGQQARYSAQGPRRHSRHGLELLGKECRRLQGRLACRQAGARRALSLGRLQDSRKAQSAVEERAQEEAPESDGTAAAQGGWGRQ